MTVYEIRTTDGSLHHTVMYRPMAEEIAKRLAGRVVKVQNFIDHDYNAQNCQCTRCKEKRS